MRTVQPSPQCEAFKEEERQKIRELEAEVQALHAENDRLREAFRIDIQNLQADIVGKNRELARVKRELTGILDPDSPEAEEVKGLLDLWWREVKDSDPRVHHGLDSTRAAKVRAAVKRRKRRRKGGGDYGGVDICRKAILGVKYDDWAMGRVAKTQGKSFNDIAEHILNTDEDIEKFARLFDQNFVTAPEVYRRLVEGGMKLPERKHPMRIALEGLRELGCDYRESSTPGQWVAQCPYHEDRPWSLYVRMAYGRCRMLCSHGCDEYVLLTGAAGFIGPSEWTQTDAPQTETGNFGDLVEDTAA